MKKKKEECDKVNQERANTAKSYYNSQAAAGKPGPPFGALDLNVRGRADITDGVQGGMPPRAQLGWRTASP